MCKPSPSSVSSCRCPQSDPLPSCYALLPPLEHLSPIGVKASVPCSGSGQQHDQENPSYVEAEIQEADCYDSTVTVTEGFCATEECQHITEEPCTTGTATPRSTTTTATIRSSSGTPPRHGIACKPFMLPRHSCSSPQDTHSPSSHPTSPLCGCLPAPPRSPPVVPTHPRFSVPTDFLIPPPHPSLQFTPPPPPSFPTSPEYQFHPSVDPTHLRPLASPAFLESSSKPSPHLCPSFPQPFCSQPPPPSSPYPPTPPRAVGVGECFPSWGVGYDPCGPSTVRRSQIPPGWGSMLDTREPLDERCLPSYSATDSYRYHFSQLLPSLTSFPDCRPCSLMGPVLLMPGRVVEGWEAIQRLLQWDPSYSHLSSQPDINTSIHHHTHRYPERWSTITRTDGHLPPPGSIMHSTGSFAGPPSEPIHRIAPPHPLYYKNRPPQHPTSASPPRRRSPPHSQPALPGPPGRSPPRLQPTPYRRLCPSTNIQNTPQHALSHTLPPNAPIPTTCGGVCSGLGSCVAVDDHLGGVAAAGTGRPPSSVRQPSLQGDVLVPTAVEREDPTNHRRRVTEPDTGSKREKEIFVLQSVGGREGSVGYSPPTPPHLCPTTHNSFTHFPSASWSCPTRCCPKVDSLLCSLSLSASSSDSCPCLFLDPQNGLPPTPLHRILLSCLLLSHDCCPDTSRHKYLDTSTGTSALIPPDYNTPVPPPLSPPMVTLARCLTLWKHLVETVPCNTGILDVLLVLASLPSTAAPTGPVLLAAVRCGKRQEHKEDRKEGGEREEEGKEQRCSGGVCMRDGGHVAGSKGGCDDYFGGSCVCVCGVVSEWERAVVQECALGAENTRESSSHCSAVTQYANCPPTTTRSDLQSGCSPCSFNPSWCSVSSLSSDSYAGWSVGTVVGTLPTTPSLITTPTPSLITITRPSLTPLPPSQLAHDPTPLQLICSLLCSSIAILPKLSLPYLTRAIEVFYALRLPGCLNRAVTELVARLSRGPMGCGGWESLGRVGKTERRKGLKEEEAGRETEGETWLCKCEGCLGDGGFEAGEASVKLEDLVVCVLFARTFVNDYVLHKYPHVKAPCENAAAGTTGGEGRVVTEVGEVGDSLVGCDVELGAGMEEKLFQQVSHSTAVTVCTSASSTPLLPNPHTPPPLQHLYRLSTDVPDGLEREPVAVVGLQYVLLNLCFTALSDMTPSGLAAFVAACKPFSGCYRGKGLVGCAIGPLVGAIGRYSVEEMLVVVRGLLEGRCEERNVFLQAAMPSWMGMINHISNPDDLILLLHVCHEFRGSNPEFLDIQTLVAHRLLISWEVVGLIEACSCLSALHYHRTYKSDRVRSLVHQAMHTVIAASREGPAGLKELSTGDIVEVLDCLSSWGIRTVLYNTLAEILVSTISSSNATHVKKQSFYKHTRKITPSVATDLEVAGEEEGGEGEWRSSVDEGVGEVDGGYIILEDGDNAKEDEAGKKGGCRSRKTKSFEGGITGWGGDKSGEGQGRVAEGGGLVTNVHNDLQGGRKCVSDCMTGEDSCWWVRALNAFTRADWYHSRFVNAVCQLARKDGVLDQLSVLQQSRLVGCMARLHHYEYDLCEKLAERIVKEFHLFQNVRDISPVIWAFANAHHIHVPLFETAYASVLELVDSGTLDLSKPPTVNSLISLCWSFVVAQFHRNPSFPRLLNYAFFGREPSEKMGYRRLRQIADACLHEIPQAAVKCQYYDGIQRFARHRESMNTRTTSINLKHDKDADFLQRRTTEEVAAVLRYMGVPSKTRVAPDPCSPFVIDVCYDQSRRLGILILGRDKLLRHTASGRWLFSDTGIANLQNRLLSARGWTTTAINLSTWLHLSLESRRALLNSLLSENWITWASHSSALLHPLSASEREKETGYHCAASAGCMRRISVRGRLGVCDS
eukprot:GHVQ01003044.1.p1 GENE.GHVQ01003044.1~~GHVQ01003044.1.p1  ORF type:complete len:1889 (-),score=269.38 GHVQ01003044.1:652-6318(-)